MTPKALRSALLAEHPGFRTDALQDDAWARLERLAAISPLYARELIKDPERCAWLEDPRNRDSAFRFQAFLDTWREFVRSREAAPGEERWLSRLRQWRRLMSLRIAYRSVNGLATEETTVAELSRLAEFCLVECLLLGQEHWRRIWGEPLDPSTGKPSRFCILALGKLGGEELNFSSDIDLLYVCEGEGLCGKGSTGSPISSVQFYTKVAEWVTQALNARTQDGFLFRADIRLRPDGAYGPLVQTREGLESHYALAGQTWERLALLKARPAAGDIAFGAEILEDLHSFRYPRRPPPSLLSEVAAMKRRTERERVGLERLALDVKQGPGGIREVEFIAQSLQLLSAGKFPFLQTHSTVGALEALARFELMPAEEAQALREAYWFLRGVEHRLQIREEEQTHSLPEEPGEKDALARSLGYDGASPFEAALARHRDRVHRAYEALFSDRQPDVEYEEWWEFFTTGHIPGRIEERMRLWFGGDPGGPEALRLFVTGSLRPQFTRELVTRFQSFASGFDSIAPALGCPREALARLGRVAERYGTRQQFLNTCAMDPQLLRTLLLLCDRSRAIADVLCAHPEILEEVLRVENFRRTLSVEDLERAIARTGPIAGDWLWLYARAEQVRYALRDILGDISQSEARSALTGLADALVRSVVGTRPALVIALGKYGGSELAFASDLDLVVLAADGQEEAGRETAELLLRTLGRAGPLGPLFSIDMRLRPHGEAGPVSTTLSELKRYHDGGGAQVWEKQLLTRARVVCGPESLRLDFTAWRNALLYSQESTPSDLQAIWSMRAKIERLRDVSVPPQRSFKTGPGGLMDIEFLVQTVMLKYGHDHPDLRSGTTEEILGRLGKLGLLATEETLVLIAGLKALQLLENALRRDVYLPVTILPDDPGERAALATWLGFPDAEAFWRHHCDQMSSVRQQVRHVLGRIGLASVPS